jgi:hypothetical protein
MQLPLQITFRHMDPSPALEARIRQRAEERHQVMETGSDLGFETTPGELPMNP